MDLFWKSKSAPSSNSAESSSSDPSKMQSSTPPQDGPPSAAEPAPTAALQPTHLRARPAAEIQARIDRSPVPFPDTMSCMTQFDVAMGCTSVRGKFRQAYRYGGWRDCGAAWSDFWFCMRYRAYPAETKREAIVERYREKEEKILAGPNCQDVWEEREAPGAQLFRLGPQLNPQGSMPQGGDEGRS